jgi:hypothetical protein
MKRKAEKKKLRPCCNPECKKPIDYDRSYFCDDACKARYWGITEGKLNTIISKNKKTKESSHDHFVKRARNVTVAYQMKLSL